MLMLIFAALISLCLLTLGGAPAMAGACVNNDPKFTQCTEYPAGTAESMIQDQCTSIQQAYVIECPAPDQKYCVHGNKKEGRIFTWGSEVDKETCGAGIWHP